MVIMSSITRERESDPLKEGHDAPGYVVGLAGGLFMTELPSVRPRL
jgi:hypothetical protein